MRRLISALSTAALVAASLATAGVAVGDEHHGDRRGGGGRGPEMHGAPPGGFFRGGGEAYRGGGRFERVEPRGEPRYEPRGGYGGERMDPRYEPRYAAPPAYQAAPRRGGYLGRGYGGPIIQDPGRLHLRPAPRGYGWVQTPSGMALVQEGTGRVYDIVPNE